MNSSDSRGIDRSHRHRSLDQRVAEREERFHRAHAVAAEAVTVAPSEREAFVVSHPDCLCNEFAELMIGLAREFRTESARDSVRCAHLAVTAVEALQRGGGEGGEDIRALAWAELGNAHRISGDLRAAGTAFHHARERVREASDPLARAEVYSLEASYLDYVHQSAKGERLLRRAERLQRRYGSPHAVGKLQIKRAEQLRVLGHMSQAIDLIESGLRNLDARREPKLTLVGVHNLAHYLILAGAYESAMTILRRYEPVYEAFAPPRVRARRTWLEAKALAYSGQMEVAEVQYLKARDTFLQLECPYEVALVLLDLTEIYSAGQRWVELERTAAETLAICQAHGVGAEGLAAAQVLSRSAARRQFSATTIGTLVAAIRQQLADGRPGIRS